MEDCLAGLQDTICQPYLDDNLVHSYSFEDHLEHVKTVLQRYQQHGVKLTPCKCELFKKQVRFLGKMVSGEGYTVDPKEIAPVQALKTGQETVGELRKLLGFISYYRPYIRDFSKVAKPLYALLSDMPATEPPSTTPAKGKQKRENKSNLLLPCDHLPVEQPFESVSLVPASITGGI